MVLRCGCRLRIQVRGSRCFERGSRFGIAHKYIHTLCRARASLRSETLAQDFKNYQFLCFSKYHYEKISPPSSNGEHRSVLFVRNVSPCNDHPQQRTNAAMEDPRQSPRGAKLLRGAAHFRPRGVGDRRLREWYTSLEWCAFQVV